jgi:hypothetical protein
LFIPFLQSELNAWMDQVNNTLKCADKNKILPHGVSNDSYMDPEHIGCLDFKVQFLWLIFPMINLFFSKIKVDPDAIELVCQQFAPQDDPVFQLVHPEFEQYAQFCMRAWEVQLLLLLIFGRFIANLFTDLNILMMPSTLLSNAKFILN